MNLFFAMGVRGANPDDASFFLRLPHLWPMFVIPIVCFYAFLSVRVVRKVREATAGESHGSDAARPPGRRMLRHAVELAVMKKLLNREPAIRI